MPELQQLSVESSPSSSSAVEEYLLHCKKVVEFKRTKQHFSITFSAKENGEGRAFLAWIEKLYGGESRSGRTPCNGTCRDGSRCLNRTMHEPYCWKHHQQKNKR